MKLSDSGYLEMSFSDSPLGSHCEESMVCKVISGDDHNSELDSLECGLLDQRNFSTGGESPPIGTLSLPLDSKSGSDQVMVARLTFW